MTDDDLIYLRGTPKELRPVITALMGQYQMLQNLNIEGGGGYSNDLESVKRVGKPKVHLYFLEDSDYNKRTPIKNVNEGRKRLDGVIRFRLMNETTQTFSKANATALGNRIKQVFGSNGGFVWKKGKTMYSYNDWEQGYQFQLLCRSVLEAKRIITAVLSLQNHSADWKNLNEVKNDQEALKYPEVPGTHLVMGELQQSPRVRPLVDVRFRYADVRLSKVITPINLYDRSGKRANVLVR